MARVKPKELLPQLKDWDEVDLALCEIAECERKIADVEIRMQEQIDTIKLASADAVTAPKERIEYLARQLRDYAEANRQEFDKRKTRMLVFGSIGYRKSTKIKLPSGTERQADIIRMLRAVGWDDCIVNPPPKINKDAVRAHPIDDIVKLGIGVQVDDEFWFETRKEELPNGTE